MDTLCVLQAQSEFRNRLALKEEEMARKEEEAEQWRQQVGDGGQV